MFEPKSAEEIGYKLVKVRGVPQNPLFDVAAFEKLISSFKSRESDVFVCSFVKAGTTWTQQIVTNLLDGGCSSRKYGQAVPWLEALCATAVLPEREAPGWSLSSVDAAPSPRYFKSHAMVEDLPGGAKVPKVIVVARNPKDTAVSLYHHAKNKPEFETKASFDEFLTVFLSGNGENGSWFKHVAEWYAESLKFPERCLFLKFEEMKKDQRRAVRQIATFIGLSTPSVPIEDKVVEDTVANSTMEAMQASAAANIGLNHLRQGKIGRWRDTFTVTQSEIFDEVYRRKMDESNRMIPPDRRLSFDFGGGVMM